MLLFLCGALILIIPSLFHLIIYAHLAKDVFIQLNYRLLLLLYCFLLSSSKFSYQEMQYLKMTCLFILKLGVLYGIYELFAKIYGLPVFLSFISNSDSFTVVDNTQGWIRFPRVRSFWAEPSMCTWPLIIFLILLVSSKMSRVKKAAWLMLAGVFIISTLSRTGIFFYFLFIFGFSMYSILGQFRISKFPLTGVFRRLKLNVFIPVIFFISLILALWPILAAQYFADASSDGRTSSILIGWEIWLDHPLIGTGFNSYELYDDDYKLQYPSYNSEPLSLSELSSFAHQLGIFGIIFIAIPFILSLVYLEQSKLFRISFATVFIIYCLISVGVLYFSIFWFFLGITLNHANRKFDLT